MKKSRWIRALALLLTVALVLSVAVSAGAARYMGDVSGDGKITVFDAQLLAEAAAGNRELTDVQTQIAGELTIGDILSYIFGDRTVDVGDMNADGVYEIYNVTGLQYMAENPSLDYILEADLDLQGAAWTPIQHFSGSFDGNGHAISNLTITEAVAHNTAATEYNQGFFGDVTAEAVVTGLNLQNVTLVSAANAKYVGLVAGTSQGTVENCTVTGSVTDSRTSLNDKKIFTGVLVGRTTSTALTVSGGTAVSSSDDTNTHTVTGLCADVKLYLEDSETVVNNGLVGYQHANTTVSGIWRDSTNNASNVTETMRERQNTVVEYMETMATVEWTVSETMTYTASGVHNQTFEPGETYYGLPYNGRNGSLERFMYCMDQVDGVNVATTRYGTDCSKTNPSGWMLYMGNDCSSAVGQAWGQVSPTRVGSYKVVNGQVVDTNATEYAGGFYVRTTDFMIPSLTLMDTTLKNENNESVSAQITYQQNHGIYPVGDWTTVGEQGTANADSIVGEFAYNADQVVNSAEVLEYNSEQTMAEAYAITRKADAIVGGDPAGHARLVVSYPVTIRNADGTIDLQQSFLVCTEHGDGLDDGNHSSWRGNYRWSYYNLLAKDEDNKLGEEDGNAASVGNSYSRCVYLPITIRALRADYVKYAYVDEAEPVTGPATGNTYTNWRTVSSTVIVADKNGNELFRHETYTGLASSNTADYYRGRGTNVDLSSAHGEAFNAFAAENLVEGQTYQYSVQLLLSNGQTLIVNRDSLKVSANGHSGEAFEDFVYTPAE